MVIIIGLAALGALIWAGLLAVFPASGLESFQACGGKPLYASNIWEEISTPAHRASCSDPLYRRELFERYAPLLRKDLERLIPRRRGLRCWFWYSCFRLHYTLLMQRGLHHLLPWNRDDLRLLLQLVLRAVQACAQTGREIQSG